MVRHWTDRDFQAIAEGDTKLLTLLFNVGTYSAETLRQYYKYAHLAKRYRVHFEADDIHEEVTIHAPSDDMLLWFLQENYICVWEHITITEIITQYRKVTIPSYLFPMI